MAAVLLMIAAGTGWLAWSITPPDRTLLDPVGGLDVLVDAGLQPNLDSISFSVKSYGDNLYALDVRLHTPRRATEPAGIPAIEVSSIAPLPCDGFTQFPHGLEQVWMGICRREVIAPSSPDWPKAVVESSWSAEIETGPIEHPHASHEYAAEFVVLAHATSEDVGVVENESDLAVITPRVSLFNENSQDRVSARFTLYSSRGPTLEWTGLSPSGVTKDWASWTWTEDLATVAQSHMHGHDPRLDVQDQHGLFLAGALAGVAGGALIASLEQGFEAILARRRTDFTT